MHEWLLVWFHAEVLTSNTCCRNSPILEATMLWSRSYHLHMISSSKRPEISVSSANLASCHPCFRALSTPTNLPVLHLIAKMPVECPCPKWFQTTMSSPVSCWKKVAKSMNQTRWSTLSHPVASHVPRGARKLEDKGVFLRRRVIWIQGQGDKLVALGSSEMQFLFAMTRGIAFKFARLIEGHAARSDLAPFEFFPASQFWFLQPFQGFVIFACWLTCKFIVVCKTLKSFLFEFTVVENNSFWVPLRTLAAQHMDEFPHSSLVTASRLSTRSCSATSKLFTRLAATVESVW